MTRPSTERPTATVSGEMLPFENAYSAPARPAKTAAITNATHWMRRASMPIASARNGESRPARIA